MTTNYLLRLTPDEAARVRTFVTEFRKATGENLPFNKLFRQCIAVSLKKNHERLMKVEGK